MANGFLPTNAGIGTIPPELYAQQQQLNRQQQLANLLTQQGFQQPQGQMVSGRYVAPQFLSIRCTVTTNLCRYSAYKKKVIRQRWI